MLNGCVILNFDCCFESISYWMFLLLFIYVYDEEIFCYWYVVKYKEGLLWLWLVKKVIGGKDDKIVKEIFFWKLNYGMYQYDIFYVLNECNQMKKIFFGQMFFVEQLYDVLSKGCNFKEMFFECEYLGFGYLSYVEVDMRFFIYWVSEILMKIVIIFF